jgi:hypothetical protein
MLARTKTYLQPIYFARSGSRLRPRYLAAELHILHVNLSDRDNHHREALNRSGWR